MVLVKMLMEIDPLLMRGSLVMTMAMIFFSSGKMAYDFSLIEILHIAEDGNRRATRGPPGRERTQGGRARPPPSWAGCGPPLELLVLIIFYIF